MKNVVFKNEFLYFSWDTFAHVLCITIRLRDFIRGEKLKEAVEESRARYPYFCRRVVRSGPEEYEILQNDAPIPVTEGRANLALGSDEANGHYLAVCFEEDKIWFDVYHNMTDAKGAVEWAKTVIYLYLCKTVDTVISSEGIRLPGSDFLPGETADPFDMLDVDAAEEPLSRVHYEKPFLPDRRYEEGSSRTNYQLKASEEGIMKIARAMDGSPAILLAFFIKEALRDLYPDMKLPIICGIPHSFRDLAAGEANYHNQIVEMTIVYDDRLNRLPMDKQLTAGRGNVILQSAPENVLYRERERMLLAASLDELPTINERRQACRDAASLIVDNPETIVITYPGRINWGGIEPYIKDITLNISALSAPIITALFAHNGVFDITMMLDHASSKYPMALVDKLREHGIDAEYIRSFPDELCSVSFP